MSTTINTEGAISADVIEQIQYALIEVAVMADTIRKNSILSTQEVSETGNLQLLEALVASNERLAAQIGYVSDLCSSKLGGIELLGGAESWLMPPAYNVLGDRESLATA